MAQIMCGHVKDPKCPLAIVTLEHMQKIRSGEILPRDLNTWRDGTKHGLDSNDKPRKGIPRKIIHLLLAYGPLSRNDILAHMKDTLKDDDDLKEFIRELRKQGILAYLM